MHKKCMGAFAGGGKRNFNVDSKQEEDVIEYVF